jgi:hypothetical protein
MPKKGLKNDPKKTGVLGVFSRYRKKGCFFTQKKFLKRKKKFS